MAMSASQTSGLLRRMPDSPDDILLPRQVLLQVAGKFLRVRADRANAAVEDHLADRRRLERLVCLPVDQAEPLARGSRREPEAEAEIAAHVHLLVPRDRAPSAVRRRRASGTVRRQQRLVLPTQAWP